MTDLPNTLDTPMASLTTNECPPLPNAIPQAEVDESKAPPGGRWTSKLIHAQAAQAAEGGTVVSWIKDSDGAKMFGFYKGIDPVQFNQLVANHGVPPSISSSFQIVLSEKSSQRKHSPRTDCALPRAARD